jgi:hypothetical protein
MNQHLTQQATSREGETFTDAVEAVSSIKREYVDPRISWYKTHTRYPRFCFRVVGIATILLSVTLPAVAASSWPKKDIALSAMSVTIAGLTGLGSFYRWERSWRGNSSAQMALEQLCAKWKLELTNARMILSPEERVKHVYKATDDLLTNARNVVSSESEGFFSGLQFPQQNGPPKD